PVLRDGAVADAQFFGDFAVAGSSPRAEQRLDDPLRLPPTSVGFRVCRHFVLLNDVVLTCVSVVWFPFALGGFAAPTFGVECAGSSRRTGSQPERSPTLWTKPRRSRLRRI